MRFLFLLLLVGLFSVPVFAGLRQEVAILEDGTYRYIHSNGIPMHAMGAFPNRGNPHSVKVQKYVYRMTLSPKMTGDTIPLGHQVFGVAVNGVPFDPATAECWRLKRGSAPMASCEWSIEAIVQGKAMLGLDKQNAHVQPSGAYHYHGSPGALMDHHQKTSMVGYAADGFSIYAAPWLDHKSSYQLKKGKRPAGAPKGRYDGTYTQDYEYVLGSGTLDACNGAYNQVSMQYYYYVTDVFPFVPRCWKGAPDPSFMPKGEGLRPPRR